MAVTNQQIIDYLLANPNLSDAQIVAAMEQNGISPSQMASAVGIPEGQITARVAATVPPGQSVQLGDTIVQPQYQTIGSGQDQQIGGLENVYSYKVGENQTGGAYQQYTPTGELQRTGTQQKVDSGLKEFALGAGALFGAPYLMNALGSAGGVVGSDLAGLSGIPAGTGALTAAESAALYGTGGATGLLTTPATTGALTTGGTGALTTAGGTGALTTAGGTSGLLSTVLPAAGTVGGALTAGALSTLGGAAANKLLGDAVTGGLGLAGGLLQSGTSKEAAQTAAQNVNKATQQAVEASQFRPVGMTTRFGTSQYTYDPVTGRMTAAGYQLSPEAKAAQDRLVGLAGRGLTQAEQAQQQFAPLQTGAQNLFGLGNQYISQSPQDVAQNYINQQMQLLQPSREMELANLQNRLQQQGRAGLSVAQGGSLGATTPELQALYNARAQQELQLAANAQQAGQQNVLFGAGLLGQGAQAMGNYYGGQASAYQPFTTALGQIQGLETAAQQPLTMGASLAQQASTAGARAGQLGLTGQQLSSAYSTGANATFNPYAGVLTAAGNPNSMFGQSIAKYLTGASATPYDALSSTKYGDGLAGYEKMIQDIYGT